MWLPALPVMENLQTLMRPIGWKSAPGRTFPEFVPVLVG